MSQSENQSLDHIKATALQELSAVGDGEALQQWRTRYLGRKGVLTGLMARLGKLSREERPAYGRAANELKQALESAFGEREKQLKEAELARELSAEGVDVTLPGRPVKVGRLHPVTEMLREIYQIFAAMGFQVYDAPDVETDEYNFELLNIPAGHPARDMWDTFYTTTPGVILRTHTSPGQIRAMREYSLSAVRRQAGRNGQAPEPLRVILPGKCYRYEQVTARSEMMFHQVEGLAVGRNITMADLKGVVVAFANQLFGAGRQLRFRCSHFPFTEPSVEVDMDCIICGQAGCRVCKYTGWLEIMGAGVVHPVVLQNGGYDPAVYSGFAFGMGPERITMLKHGIDDIRYFFTNDARFLAKIR